MLSGSNDFSLCRQIQEDPRHRGVPVIFLTARRDPEEIVKAFEAGAVDYITKPFSISEILARVRTHVRLHESEQRHRYYVNHAPHGIIVTDAKGRMLEANPAAAALAGLRSDQVEGTPMDDLVAGSHLGDLHRLLEQDIPQQGRAFGVYEMRSADEAGCWMAATVTALPHERLLWFVEDITEKRRREEQQRLLDQRMQAAQKSESLRVLAGGIAHDFNNLLQSILGNAEFLELQLDDDTSMAEVVTDIAAAARRAAELTRQMLNYSGRVRLRFAPVRVSRIVAGMQRLLNSAATVRIRMVYDLSEDDPPVQGDEAQIEQVIMNLVVNAAQATDGRNPDVICRVHHVNADGIRQVGDSAPDPPYAYDRVVLLEVIDHGCGMPEPVRQRVFDPFFSTKGEGRGLGLASVQGIVRAHFGGIAIETEPHLGTRFTVVLPVPRDPGEAIRITAGDKEAL
jgi:PAS domain S-box-containing protein